MVENLESGVGLYAYLTWQKYLFLAIISDKIRFTPCFPRQLLLHILSPEHFCDSFHVGLSILCLILGVFDNTALCLLWVNIKFGWAWNTKSFVMRYQLNSDLTLNFFWCYPLAVRLNNPLSPNDALKHHSISLKTDLIFQQTSLL